MRKIILTACLCLLFTAGTSMADYLYWNLDTGSGNVDDVTNWTCTWPVGNPDKVPGDGDLAIIKKNGTVLIDATHLFSGIPTDIWVGDGTGINNPIDDWPHSPNDPGEGHVLQTGGTVNYAYWFLVGRANAPGTSTYDMQGGAITQTEAGGLFIIGEAGATGIMTVSNDAAISVLTPAYIGTGGGGSGTLSLSGTSTAMFSEVHLGESATGAINLSDSAILTSGGYNIFGTGAGGASTLTMSDDSQFIGGYGHVGGSNSGASQITMSGNSHIQFTYWLNMGEANGTGVLQMSENASIGAASIDFGWGANTNSTGVMSGTSSITVAGDCNLGVWGDNAQGNVTMNDSSTLTAGGALSIGKEGAGIQSSLTMNGSSTASTTFLNVGSNGAGTQGTLTLNDSARVIVNGAAAIGNVAGATGTVIMSGDSSLTASSWLAISNSYGGGGGGAVYMSDNSTLSVTDNEMEIAWGGTGVLHLGDGTLTDNAVASSLYPVILGWGTASMDTNARIDLNGGGTLVAPGISTGNDGAGLEPQSSVLNFNGGTLKASADNADYMTNPGGSLVFQANVQAGGARIDTDGYDIAIYTPLTEDPLSLGGGLTKVSEGTLTLGGACTYTGPTTVSAGVLSVMGSITSDVCVNSGAKLLGAGLIAGDVMAAGAVAPGGSIGTMTVTGDASICGALDVEYESDTDTVDLLDVAGILNITGATINFLDVGTVAPDQIYVFATYLNLVGAPAAEVGVPAGYTVDYAYNGNSIALVPEPATLGLLSLGILGLLRRRKRA